MFAPKFQKSQPEVALLHDTDPFKHIFNPAKHFSPQSAKSYYDMWIYSDVQKYERFVSCLIQKASREQSALLCSEFQQWNRQRYLLHLVLEHEQHSIPLASFCTKEPSCGRMINPSKSRKQRQSVQRSALFFPLLPSDVLLWYFTTSTQTAAVPCKGYISPPAKCQIKTLLPPHSGKKTFTEQFPQVSWHVKGLRDSAEPCLGGNTAQAERKRLCALFPLAPLYLVAHRSPASSASKW